MDLGAAARAQLETNTGREEEYHHEAANQYQYEAPTIHGALMIAACKFMSMLLDECGYL